ncbi:MFS transporter [Arthrobacter sp. SDTb3-6]|uniref:MFS transporter n=1 Tax=Arthrobacter sp. SDTb3-6 TaxID=2713571 RepID=UPI00159E3D1D|nr:MFS transporter [Arthrobacter sp. SDTb3-6]NVM99863.1 MHS family MFS transporter [Arthrobacter sp. SDTb3-6]
MDTDRTAAPPRKKQGARAFIVALTGTSLEWYDFAVYSAASALVFGHVFFHSADPLAGTLAAFGTYAVGYVARPLGGFFFGRLGDLVGRKKVLVWTLILIGVATFGVGLIPPYASIGLMAPLLLVFLRLCQGVGVGGEWAGAVLISAEHGDPKRKGFFGSAAQIGPPLGNLMANGVLALLTVSMSHDSFLAWGWRLAFLLSAILVGVGLVIRVKIEETPVFEEIKAQGLVARSPLKDVFTKELRGLCAATMSRIAPDVMYALSTVFVLVYATREHGLNSGQALLAVVIGSALQTFMVPLAGYLSDRMNRRVVVGIGAALSIAWPFIFFPLMGIGFTGVVAAVIAGLLCNSLMYGPQAALVTEQFSPRLRYAGSSLAYTLGGVFGGAIAPLLFTFLLGTYGSWVPMAIYIIIVSVITVIGVWMARNPDPDEQITDDFGSHAMASGPTAAIS